MTNYPFADLRQLLLNLGFEMKVVPGSYIVFQHGPAHARLVLEPFSDGDPVDPTTLAVVGRNLDERGILSRARFEELIQKHPLAG
jgi:hypothetical protein